MQVRILDVDASLMAQPTLCAALAQGGAHKVELRDLARHLRIVARRGTLTELRRRLALDELAHGAGPCLDFFGSGDFHHITAVLLERFREPLTVIHIDNHPDWVRWPRTFNCGGWINRALELPHVRRIITLGPCSDDLSLPELKLANLQALAAGRLEVYPWRHAPSRVLGSYGSGASYANRGWHLLWRTLADESWEHFVSGLLDRIPTDAVYVTIDKDALASPEAVTNWDQGEMPLSHVLAIINRLSETRRLIGADVCGDYSPPLFKSLGRALLSWFDRGSGPVVPRNAAALNDVTNARLLQAFTRYA